MLRFLAALTVVLGLWTQAQAEEVITRFDSDVAVNADASLQVTETISVIAEGNDIRRGIFRDFPTRYKDAHGNAVNVGFSIVRVRRDGRDEHYAIESLSNGKRIRIGDKDVFLKYGSHTYEITYQTTRQLGFFEDHDELYWNVTGNDWKFPIQISHVNIHLPPGAAINQTAIYTGPSGSRGQDARITSQSGREFSAATTRTLGGGEGFTVAVGWQKGIVAPPSEAQKQVWFLRDNAGYGALIATLLSVAGYFFFAWNKVGRDPPSGTIVPLFYPPKGFGPAATRYVWQQKFDHSTFVAALIGLGAAGLVKISEEGGTYSVTKLASNNEPLARAEQALYDRLPSGTTELEQSNHSTISGLISAVDNSLETSYYHAMFENNLGWFTIGAVISVLGLFAAFVLMPDSIGMLGLFVGAFSSIWWTVIFLVGWAAVKSAVIGRGILLKLRSFVGLIALVPFVGGGLAVPVAVLGSLKWSPIVVALIVATVGLGLLNILFYKLLPAPTPAGRQVMDQIDGFRLYMTAAEERRLNMLNPPEKTPALFERYLPYAMALGCENEWNAKFAAVLAAAAAGGAAAAYTPSWYSSHSGGSWSDVSSGFGSDLASAVSSSSTAPGSSSGSGGGGSSGGGGGGGGGGGW